MESLYFFALKKIFKPLSRLNGLAILDLGEGGGAWMRMGTAGAGEQCWFFILPLIPSVGRNAIKNLSSAVH